MMSIAYSDDFELVVFGSDVEGNRTLLSSLLSGDNGYLDRATTRVVALLLSSPLRSIVIEKNYIDIDYKASFGSFYFMKFHDVDRRCTRLHFFSIELSVEHLLSLEDASDNYLGFVVVRPLRAHRLGRSILSEKLLNYAPAILDSANETRHLSCRANYLVNLAGSHLALSGCPWMQQDTMVSACASASLWIANWHLAHRYHGDFSLFTTPQITELASQYSIDTGRAMPSEGLTVEQMLAALKGMGYTPLIRFPEGAAEVKRISYYYVESGIPVIAILTFPGARAGHAVALVGHTLDTTLQNSPDHDHWPNVLVPYSRSSDFVPRFISQDDSGGPMRFLAMKEWADVGLDKAKYGDRYRCAVVFDEGTPYQRIAYLRSLLVPLPPRVILDGRHAEKQARSTISAWYNANGKPPQNTLVTRTFLLPSNDLKRWWKADQDHPSEIAEEIRRHAMSKWVWLTEFADRERLKKDRIAVLGQVVQDSAGHGISSEDFDLLAFCTPNSVQIGRPNGDYISKQFEEVTPYKQYEAG